MTATILWSGQVFKGLFIKKTVISNGGYTYYTHYFETKFGSFNVLTRSEEIKAMTQHGPVKILAVEQ